MSYAINKRQTYDLCGFVWLNIKKTSYIHQRKIVLILPKLNKKIVQ